MRAVRGWGLSVALTLALSTACSNVASAPSLPGTRAPSAPATSEAAIAHGGAVNASILIQRDVHETFDPPRAGMTPRLTARQVWQRGKRIPDATSYGLGLLTLPPQHNDELAWGFRSGPNQCTFTGIYQPRHPPSCYRWLFFDANSGRFLDGTQQRVSLISATPSPIPTATLLAAGVLSGEMARFAPTELEYNSPESVIRWAWDETTCQISLHWFSPVQTQQGKTHTPCEWHHRFSIDVDDSFVSRGQVFEVVAGHQQKRYGEQIRATLADGRTSIVQSEDGAWILVVQRCGSDFDGTAVAKVDELSLPGHHLLTGLPLSPAAARAGPTADACGT
jgi:hypothetical protein